MSDIYKLQYNGMTLAYPGWNGYISFTVDETSLNLGPINTWTIPSTTTDCISYPTQDTVRLYGKGGHYEVIYKAFTVDETGLYEVTYDYNIPTLNFYGTDRMHQYFGLFITTNAIHGGDMPEYTSLVGGNCIGQTIVNPGTQNNSPGSGSIHYQIQLTAGTTYYAWLPFANLADGVETFYEFTNMKVAATTNTDNIKVQTAIAYMTAGSQISCGGRSNATKTINANISSYRYCALKFEHVNAHPSSVWASDININNWGWNIRTHYQAGNYKGVRIGGSFTAKNSNVASRTQDGSALRYYKSVADSTNATYKFLLDRNNNTASAYINNTYLGYGSTNSSLTALANVKISQEQTGNITAKNFNVAGFPDIADAAAF